MSNKQVSFTKWLDNNWQKDNMFPLPLEAQTALNFLKEYLLGEDWYIINPISITQSNVEIVDAILTKYSKKYRKEKRKNGNRYTR